jgi:CheY-like chemotaxis protein
VAEGARRVLLAEDDRFLRRAASAGLRQRGFTVLTAEDGEQALTVARAERPDLVLLDLIMPKLQGFEVLKALKRDPATTHIPVIVLSNLGQDQDMSQAMTLGAVAYFIKAHLSLHELVQKVTEVLADGVGR